MRCYWWFRRWRGREGSRGHRIWRVVASVSRSSSSRVEEKPGVAGCKWVLPKPKPTSSATGGGAVSKAPVHIQLINTQIRTSSKARTPIILVSIDVHEIVITPRIRALRWLKLRCSLLRPIRNARGTCQHLRRAKLHPLALASGCERPRGPGLRRERRRERKPSRDTGAGR